MKRDFTLSIVHFQHSPSPLSIFPSRFPKRFILKIITFLMLFPCLAFAQGAIQDLDSNWQYRWGDSPFSVNGIPEWSIEEHTQDEWLNIDFPSNPPNRDGKTNVWYRTTLPDNGIWRVPVIYIYSVDLITEAYIDGHRIYNYGSFDQHGLGRFEGWPWHMVNLPDDFAGKTIYFRIFSSASDIGLWGEVKLMDRIDLFRYIIDKSITDIAVSSLSLVIALLALIFAFIQSNRQTFLLIFFFTFASSVMLFAQSQVKQLFFNAPIIWDHIAAAGYFVLPIAIAMLFDSWCAWKFTKVIKAIWKFHLVFVIIAIGSSATGLVELSSMYYLFDVLLSLSLLILFLITFSQVKQVNNDVKIQLTSFAIFSLFLLIDMGVAHNILPWTRMPIAIGSLLFSITLVGVSLHHFAVVQNELKKLNETLEQKVEDRTEELKQLASTDPLTTLMNRRSFYIQAEVIFQKSIRYRRNISILMLDIDHFKQFNDDYGHAVGDTVLISVANSIQQVCRETDLPARVGGEEFMILLEETDTDEALLIAERLRQVISEINIPKIETKITASIGISNLEADIKNLDELILRADEAMYMAKNKGRNNCYVA
jgi:diguanylate cyclase (GGDEF)-like protein